MINANPFKNRRSNRFGVAATEFVLFVPILFIIIGGTIEICAAMFLQEALTVAAYEGARQGVQRMGTTDNITNRAGEVLNERGISITALSGDLVTVEPNPETAAIFTPITVTVRAPTSGNTALPFAGWYSWFGQKEFEASVTMRKEFADIVE